MYDQHKANTTEVDRREVDFCGGRNEPRRMDERAAMQRRMDDHDLAEHLAERKKTLRWLKQHVDSIVARRWHIVTGCAKGH